MSSDFFCWCCDIKWQILSPHLCSLLEKSWPPDRQVKGQQEAQREHLLLASTCLSFLLSFKASLQIFFIFVSDSSCCFIGQESWGDEGRRTAAIEASFFFFIHQWSGDSRWCSLTSHIQVSLTQLHPSSIAPVPVHKLLTLVSEKDENHQIRIIRTTPKPHQRAKGKKLKYVETMDVQPQSCHARTPVLLNLYGSWSHVHEHGWHGMHLVFWWL